MILKKDEILLGIDAHEQKYEYSCAPSAVEMVLKLLDRICEDYHECQEEWKKSGKKRSDLEPFNGRECKGVAFSKHYLPAEGLFQVIDNELKAGRYVIISLENPCGFHMWVIYGKKDGNYLSFTKRHGDRHPIFCCCDLKNYVCNMRKASYDDKGKTDILTYKEVL